MPSGASRTVRAVVFDLDGTLVDSKGSVIRCLREFAERESLKLPQQTFQGIFGPPLWRTLTPLYESEKAAIKAAGRFRDLYLRKWVAQVRVFQGVTGLLRMLSNRRVERYVVSSNQDDVVQGVLAATRLTPLLNAAKGTRFDHDQFVSKEMLLQEFLNAMPEAIATIMVGDTESDCHAARMNKVEFWAVTYGYSTTEEVRSMQPNVIVDSVEILADRLRDSIQWGPAFLHETS